MNRETRSLIPFQRKFEDLVSK